MSTSKSAAIKNRVSKKTNALVLAIVTTSLTMGVSMSAQAGSLSSLFGNNSSGSSKFLPVDQAFKA
ncbi:hypothetical protein [Psychrobacter sp.]|uniref:hypothetical protein n=1 Tax=Psychrobacter sp. TaxID=56811 RepID=UPI003F984621